MKERIIEHWRVLTASLFSVVLVAGVYILAKGVESPPTAQASTESALLQAVATKDSDNDGLPDWEESLYGTNPRITDTSHLGMTDGEAVSRGLIVPVAIADVPGISSSGSSAVAQEDNTLTAAFAKTFFTLYVAAKKAKDGGDLSEAEMNDVAAKALESLSLSVAPVPDFKSTKDIKVFGSGPDALKAFAVSAEAVLLKNTSIATTSEIRYLERAIESGDEKEIPYIASIASAYRGSAAGLAVLPVPVELAKEDLAIINALMRAGKVISDFTVVNSDPLVTMLALKQYPQAILDLGNAFIQIGTVYKAAGISLPAGTPGAAFVNLMKDLAATQQAAKKP
ncbi:MAG: thrombospondin type 3 repeat-containing protein [bacterium]|nr:thrombospondin type 3 repeat-containing protein [bacterium]